MAIVVFFLGLILFVAGAAGLAASLDLLPTELGMLYAVCGAIACCSAFIVFSIAAVIRRLDALAGPGQAPTNAPMREEPSIDFAHAFEEPPRAEVAPGEDPVNENRTGRLPTLHEVEDAIAHPQAMPTLVGRYSAGGANYMIFSDGTIEAETDQGAYRFASMGEFKAFIAGRQT